MQDRNTCILFGDGAAAAVVGEVEEGFGMLSTYLGAEGEDEDILRTPAGGTKKPNTAETIVNRENFVKMKGQDVFKFAVHALPSATNKALKIANVKSEDLHMIFPHQANVRIIESAAKRIHVPLEKFYMNLQRFGNTSSASVGLALGEALEKGMVKKGDILIALYGANSGEVALSKIDGAINQAILCLRHETNNAFVYHYFNHIKNWIVSRYIQGGQGNLSGQIIKSVNLYFPKPEEQKKVADCLSEIDAMISEQSNKVEQLKAHKKGLMQGLFPSCEEANV